MVRGIEGNSIFRDDKDRHDFLRRMRNATSGDAARCLSWSLMTNHAHAFLETLNKPICRVMHELNTGYAMAYNRRHERTGYLFQNRYKSLLVEDEDYAQKLIRYIHRNPIRAGIVADLESLASYPWTGHPELIGSPFFDLIDVEGALRWFGDDDASARKTMMDFMQHESPGDDPFSIWIEPKPGRPTIDLIDERTQRCLVGIDNRYSFAAGSAEFVSRTIEAQDQLRLRQITLKTNGWSEERLIDWVCSRTGIHATELSAGRRFARVSESRALIAALAVDELGLRASDLAPLLGVTNQAVTGAIRRGREHVEVHRLCLPTHPPTGQPKGS